MSSEAPPAADTPDDAASGPPAPPGLPPGRSLHLSGRGHTWVHDSGAPSAGAPTLLLLHGWTATAAVNFYGVMDDLARDHRVVALDHRGHGRGLRTDARFRLADCADDAAATLDALEIDRAVVVGYSMGGPVAQLVWHRHRDRVTGLVLCATSRNFRGHPRDRALFALAEGAARASGLVPDHVRGVVRDRVMGRRYGDDDVGRWARAEVGRHDPRLVAEAGAAIGRFSSHDWIGEVDVPTAVVVTARDRVVPPHRQHKLAAAIPGATVHEVDGDHTVVAWEPDVFRPVLRRAVTEVVSGSAT